MTTSRSVRAAAAVATLLLLATACAQDAAGAGPASGEDITYADDDVALRVEYTGGFTTPAVLATRLPVLTVYGDGRVITEGPQIMIYPAPALPNLQVQRISRDDVLALVDRALDAGVGTQLDFGDPLIADGATTKFTVMTQVGPQVTEVYALPEAGGADHGLTDDQVAAREAMRDLFAALTDLATTLGAAAVSDEGPYQPTALAAVVEPWQAADEPDEQPEIAWPGPELPGEPFNPDLGLHCVTVTGAELDAVLAAAAEANQRTPWLSGGERYQVTLRPLLPDETGCAGLQE